MGLGSYTFLLMNRIFVQIKKKQKNSFGHINEIPAQALRVS